VYVRGATRIKLYSSTVMPFGAFDVVESVKQKKRQLYNREIMPPKSRSNLTWLCNRGLSGFVSNAERQIYRASNQRTIKPVPPTCSALVSLCTAASSQVIVSISSLDSIGRGTGPL